MNLLLDSHALLWALHDPGRIEPDAARAIRDPERTVLFSAASAWEIEIKAATGRLELPGDWLEAAETIGFLELPITAEAARNSARLPWHHRDPFDRMLVAQAMQHDLEIATRDEMIPRYGVRVLPV